MRHLLPRRTSSSTASSRSKTAQPTQQRPKPASAPVQPQTQAEPEVNPYLCPAKRYPFPKWQGPCPKLDLDLVQPKESWCLRTEEVRVMSHWGRTTLKALSSSSALFSSGHWRRCNCCLFWARPRSLHTQTPYRCDSKPNKMFTVSQKVHSSSQYFNRCRSPASARGTSAICHSTPGIASHPQSVELDFGHNRTRLLTPICSKTSPFQGYGPHFSLRRQLSCPQNRSSVSTIKRRCGQSSHRMQRVRLSQPLLPRPQERWRPILSGPFSIWDIWITSSWDGRSEC